MLKKMTLNTHSHYKTPNAVK